MLPGFPLAPLFDDRDRGRPARRHGVPARERRGLRGGRLRPLGVRDRKDDPASPSTTSLGRLQPREPHDPDGPRDAEGGRYEVGDVRPPHGHPPRRRPEASSRSRRATRPPHRAEGAGLAPAGTILRSAHEGETCVGGDVMNLNVRRFLAALVAVLPFRRSPSSRRRRTRRARFRTASTGAGRPGRWS